MCPACSRSPDGLLAPRTEASSSSGINVPMKRQASVGCVGSIKDTDQAKELLRAYLEDARTEPVEDELLPFASGQTVRGCAVPGDRSIYWRNSRWTLGLSRGSRREPPAMELDGRLWERTVAGLLHRPGFTRRQGPGSLNLFGSPTLSGARHEIDAAADSWRGLFMVECKATAGGITKSDAAIFYCKIMDYYQSKIKAAAQEQWWGFLCGTEPTPASARASAVNLGLLVCDPARLPLPVLFRAASRPAADMHLSETLLQEIVRLGERAFCCHQERWPYQAESRKIAFNPHRWRDGEIEDHDEQRASESVSDRT